MSNYRFDLLTTARSFGIEGEPTLRQTIFLSMLVIPVSTFWIVTDFIFDTIPDLLLGLDRNRPVRYEHTSKGIQRLEQIEYQKKAQQIRSNIWG